MAMRKSIDCYDFSFSFRPVVIGAILVSIFGLACGGGGGSGGSASAGPIDAPASLSGRTIDARVTSGSGLLASQGTFRASFAAATYAIQGDGVNTINSNGSYTYAAVGSVGTANFNDTQVGSGVFAFTYTSATGGTYSLNIPGGGSQAGTFVEP